MTEKAKVIVFNIINMLAEEGLTVFESQMLLECVSETLTEGAKAAKVQFVPISAISGGRWID